MKSTVAIAYMIWIKFCMIHLPIANLFTSDVISSVLMFFVNFDITLHSAATQTHRFNDELKGFGVGSISII